MKNLTPVMAEGLLDKDFDVPDFNFEPITPNIPAMIDDGVFGVRLIKHTS